MSEFIYNTPVNIANAFETRNDVADFIEFISAKLQEHETLNSGDGEYIPPIIYNVPGKVFNIDYNFMISVLAVWVGKYALEGDFKLDDSQTEYGMRAGIFLVVGLLESFYGVVRLNTKKVDTTKYRGQIELKDRFYNMIIMKNGKKICRFSAVPFSASIVRNMISQEAFERLYMISCNNAIEQVAFGTAKCQGYISQTIEPISFVFN